MKNTFVKRLTTFALAAATAVTTLAVPATTFAAARSAVVTGSGYGQVEWNDWCQKQSSYSGVRKSGCRVVAFSKMLYEAGFTSVGNPDSFFEWGKSKNYFLSSAYENTNFGKAVIKYAEKEGGSASIVEKKSINGYSASAEESVLDYLRRGYYVTLSCAAHTTYVGRQESLSSGRVVLLDSSFSGSGSRWWGEYGSRIKWSDYGNYKTFTNIRAFRIDGGNTSAPAAPVAPEPEPAAPAVVEPAATVPAVQENKKAESTLNINVANVPDGKVFKIPGTFCLKGTIESNYKITKAFVYLSDANGNQIGDSVTIEPYSTYVDIRESDLNKKLMFGKVKKEGNFYLNISATDESGRTENRCHRFVAQRIW